MAEIIVDTGPLVALFDCSCDEHDWALAQIRRFSRPMITCEPVVTEVLFLLERECLEPDHLFALFERGVLRCEFSLETEWESVRKLMRQYRSLPASLADASLIRLSELEPDSVVFTLDQDFLVYRRNRRQRIPLLAPFVDPKAA